MDGAVRRGEQAFGRRVLPELDAAPILGMENEQGVQARSPGSERIRARWARWPLEQACRDRARARRAGRPQCTRGRVPLVWPALLGQVDLLPGGQRYLTQGIVREVMNIRREVVERLLLVERYPGHVVYQQLLGLVVF